MNHFATSSIRNRCFERGWRLAGLSGRAGLIALWLCLTSAGAWAQPATSLGAILLKNDRVLLGRVEPRGEFFLVHIADSSQVSLPKDQVQYVGRTIEDLYDYKLTQLPTPNTGDHFRLTRWCMANHLSDQAVTHYDQVSKQAGNHPRVNQLAIELKNQLLEDPGFRVYLGLAPQLPVAESADAAIAQSAMGASESEGTDSVVAAGNGVDALPAPHIVARFGDRLQPILINRCSQAACHGAQSDNSLRLIKPHSKFHAQTSASNLASVLGHVSPDPASGSALLAYATRAHGLQRQPGIAITETVLVDELRSWVSMVQNPVVSAGAIAPRPALARSPTALVPARAGADQLKQVPRSADWRGAEHVQFPDGETAPSDAELDALERQFDQRALPAAAQPLSLPGALQSLDPFDPAEFNRRVQVRAGT